MQTRINITIIAEQCVRVCESYPRTHNNIMYNIYICVRYIIVYTRECLRRIFVQVSGIFVYAYV